MIRKSVIFLLFASLLFAREYVNELKAYLTTKAFQVDGIMYTHDFNNNGQIEYNEYVYVSQKSGNKYRLLGTTPTKDNAFGFAQVEVSLKDFAPIGYFSYIGFDGDDDQRFSWLYLSASTGKVYKLMGVNENHFFRYLQIPPGQVGLSDLTYVIDDQKVFIVYKNLQSFPHIVAYYDTPGFSWNVAVSEGYMAYVADGAGGVIALQIEGISLYYPQLFAQANISPAFDVAIDSTKSRLYATKDGSEVVVMYENSLQQVASIALPHAHDIVQLALSSDKKALYVLDGLHKLYVIDISTPGYPITKEIAGEISSINVQGDKLYVTNSAKGISIYSLQDPCKPHLHTKIKITGLNSIAPLADQNTLYASAYGSTKLYVINANPKIKRLSKAVENYHEIYKIVVDEQRNRLYTLNTVASIDVYDITQKYDPKYLKTIYMPYPVMDMQVSSDGKLGFIANGGDGFKIINLTN